jgi:hypothetical protein
VNALEQLSALLEQGRAETEACIARLRDPLHAAATGRLEKRPPKAHVTNARPKLRPKDADRLCNGPGRSTSAT